MLSIASILKFVLGLGMVSVVCCVCMWLWVMGIIVCSFILAIFIVSVPILSMYIPSLGIFISASCCIIVSSVFLPAGSYSVVFSGCVPVLVMYSLFLWV